MPDQKLHILPQDFEVDRQAREKLNGHRSLVLWFTGLSGSGKSTIANHVERELHRRKYRTYTLDGDNIRGGLNSDLDFSEAGRQENIRRIAEVAKLFADCGAITLTAFISPFRADREKARQIIGEQFVEIFVDASLETCEKRDVKGLYKKARSGEISNFTGIDSPFEPPEKPELRLDSDALSAEECALEVLKYAEKRAKPERK